MDHDHITEGTQRNGLGPVLLVAVLLLSGCVPAIHRYDVLEPGANRSGYPGEAWLRYPSPEAAGWSSAGLAEARTYSEAIGSAAVLIVQDGIVVDAWGKVSTRYLVHSIRKSLLSALIGIYVAEGAIDLQKTLADLHIDDDPPLTPEERQARVVDLLTSRSGVYHTAAAEPQAMKDGRPQRGSHPTGSHWYYNNWDFNALGSIFESATGVPIFRAFLLRIAEPTCMEDFREKDGYYRYEHEQSMHPAYHFRMTANDLARLGLLFLRSGAWLGKQLVPRDWVEASTRPHSAVNDKGLGYGYMWWIGESGPLAGMQIFSALGAGGHAVHVLPQDNLVIVHRADTESGSGVGNRERRELVRKILDARPRRVSLGAAGPAGSNPR